MANPVATISKIQLPDGTLVALSNNIRVQPPEGSEYTIKVNVTNFSGTVSLIQDQDYKLTITS